MLPDQPKPEPFALIAVNRPVFGNFHYRVPPGMRADLALGSRVSVPFGGGRAVGVCVGFDEGPPPLPVEKMKPISALVDTEPAWRELLEKDRPTFDSYVPDGTHPSPKGDAAITTPRVLAAFGL